MFSKRGRRRLTLGTLVAAPLIMGGLLAAYVIPIVLNGPDLRYVEAEQISSGLLVGLLLAVLGVSVAQMLTQPRVRRR